MTTLVDIPSCTALHIPTPTSQPLPLSSGDLTLTLIPANPPTHPSQTVTLTIGASSFPLLPNSPVQKIQSAKEHASYIFTPVPADGGAGIGRVKIVMKDSKSQGEWEATEALCSRFEAALKANGVWDEKTLFVDDEYEATAGGAHKGWGETIAGAVMGVGQQLADRLNSYTDQHIETTNPTHPDPPSSELASQAHTLNTSTTTLSTNAETGSTKIGEYVHEAGKTVGSYLPDSIAKAAEPVKEEDKSDFRKIAADSWSNLTIAAKGMANAGLTVGGALSESAHRAVEHNFGKEADKVAQDLGQTGANLGSTAMAASSATSGIIQGSNVGSGIIHASQ